MIKKIDTILIVSLILALIIFFATSLGVNMNNNLKERKDLETLKIAVVFTGSGLGDKSFNDLIYDGLLKAQKELGIEFDYAEPIYPEEYEKSLMEFAETEEYQLIIAIGPEQENDVKAVSEIFPNQKFTLIDSKLEANNVSSIYTRWEEQAFLNGVISGILSKKEYEASGFMPKAGIILGMEVPHLREGAIGFEAGFKYVNPEGEVMSAVVNDFKNPLKARETALLMYSKGVKYIQHLAGASGLGVFSAAKESGGYAFGVDENQNFFEPNVIISTATRYMNQIIFNEIKYVKDNSWNDGVHLSGLKEGIIDITREGSQVELDPYVMKTVKKIKSKIVNDELTIPKSKEELDDWVKVNKYKD
ncbi:BMP family ABC transporter substrate-binding protein [Clostridium sp. CTA-7]